MDKIKVAKELVKLAKSLIARGGSVNDLAQALYNMISNPDEGVLRYELPSGKWVTFQVDTEEGKTVYLGAITSDYAMFNEPWGFWYADVNDLCYLYEDDDFETCQYFAQQAFDVDRNYEFSKNQKDEIYEMLNEGYLNRLTSGQETALEEHFDEFIDILNSKKDSSDHMNDRIYGAIDEIIEKHVPNDEDRDY